MKSNGHITPGQSVGIAAATIAGIFLFTAAVSKYSELSGNGNTPNTAEITAPMGTNAPTPTTP